MFEHYIALDWSQKIVAVARMTAKINKPTVFEGPPDVRKIREYLRGLKGTKALTFEETSTSQWLYTELRDSVDELIVCDPYRNRLLADGPKTDKNDAIKLCQLLKAGLLKPVFHQGGELIEIRKLVSGYEDLVQAGVRLKNQRSGLYLSRGGKELSSRSDRFVLEGLEKSIEAYELEKSRYEKEFQSLAKNQKAIRALTSIPGFGAINAAKFAAIVVDANRFEKKSGFLSYCGLVQLEKMSGGVSYGKKFSRYNRRIKGVLKSAAITALTGKNPFRDTYEYLIREKNYPDYNARHAVCRLIARVALATMRTERNFDPEKIRSSRPH